MGYVYLALAIAGELAGTTFLKYSAGFTKIVPSILALVLYSLCFVMLSRSLLTINLSIAYATWSGLGIVAATMLSVFLFKEQINIIGVISIIFIVIGIVILNLYGSGSISR